MFRKLMPVKSRVEGVEGVPSPGTAYSCDLSKTDDGLVLRYQAAPSSGGGEAEVRFGGVSIFKLGWPNDEVLNTHPLWERGLVPYAFQEVFKSDWVADLERANSIHPGHLPGMFDNSRHFIVTFKDETFECLARTLDVKHKPAAGN
jgi:hypothetical protein